MSTPALRLEFFGSPHVGGGGGTILRIDCGGPDFVDGAGDLWHADLDFSGGSTIQSFDPVAGTTDDTLYQYVRFGSFSYSIPVSSGQYKVELRFNDHYAAGTGQRVFDVYLNGTLVLDHLDIRAVTGAVDTALDYEFTTSAGVTSVDITFVNHTDVALIAGIQVVPA